MMSIFSKISIENMKVLCITENLITVPYELHPSTLIKVNLKTLTARKFINLRSETIIAPTASRVFVNQKYYQFDKATYSCSEGLIMSTSINS